MDPLLHIHISQAKTLEGWEGVGKKRIVALMYNPVCIKGEQYVNGCPLIYEFKHLYQCMLAKGASKQYTAITPNSNKKFTLNDIREVVVDRHADAVQDFIRHAQDQFVPPQRAPPVASSSKATPHKPFTVDRDFWVPIRPMNTYYDPALFEMVGDKVRAPGTSLDGTRCFLRKGWTFDNYVEGMFFQSVKDS